MEHTDEGLSTRDLVATADPPTTTNGAPESAAAGSTDVTDDAPLLAEDQASTYRRRWEEIQAAFVDEPRRAVEDADGLVASVMQELAEGFARERERLESQWDRGDDVSTEDLRLGLQRYRSFFRRLLSA